MANFLSESLCNERIVNPGNNINLNTNPSLHKKWTVTQGDKRATFVVFAISYQYKEGVLIA